MPFAGISWSEHGFELVMIDEGGRQTTPPRTFPAGQIWGLVDHLRRTRQVRCVVDSTNGLIDGMLMEAGLPVYRADPGSLPPRPRFGSADARALAGAAVHRFTELTLLDPVKGTLTGRRSEQFRQIARSEQDAGPLRDAGRYVAYGDRSDPARSIALTFDDGPNPPYTGMILDVLARYGVPATFFCVGMRAAAHPDELARIVASGHEVGNHTWSHPFLPDLSERELAEQVERTDAAAGYPAARLFRPPYGTRTPMLMSWLTGRHDGHRLVLWDVDSADWQRPGPDAIAKGVLKQSRPGSIILMHDGGGDRSQTVDALPAIIDGLLADGYNLTLAGSLFPRKEKPHCLGPQPFPEPLSLSPLITGRTPCAIRSRP
ncbi:MAG TPA: polysaccharide deacetylase family protein [Streptosporangiaceae bacterium]|nr:polysaccharide deacetylase family protein [Streptosporangiaceae bacterium]